MGRVVNILKVLCFVVIVSGVGVYVSDFVWIEYRKNGRLEVFYNQPQSEVCVYALFPHAGYRPCWYAVRNKVRTIG